MEDSTYSPFHHLPFFGHTHRAARVDIFARSDGLGVLSFPVSECNERRISSTAHTMPSRGGGASWVSMYSAGMLEVYGSATFQRRIVQREITRLAEWGEVGSLPEHITSRLSL